MAVSREEVLHVARLARLHLSDPEIERFTLQLNGILAHMDALAQVEQPRVESMIEGEPRVTAPLREDVPNADLLQRAVSELAASWAEGFFTVPRLPALDVELGSTDPET